MSRVTRTWIQASVGVIGLGASFAWPAVGVAIASVNTLATCFAVVGLNVPSTRAAYWVAVAAQVGAIFQATGSPLLALAVVAAGLTGIPSQGALLNAGKAFRYLPLLGGLVAGLLIAAAWPVGLWGLALAPNLFVNFVFGPQLAAGARRWPDLVANIKLRVGEPMPELRLPRRDGSGEVDLGQERGQPVLILFVRGDWCPICHVLMRVVNRERETLRRLGAKLFLITPAEGEVDGELAERLALDTDMLLDRNADLARAWGLIEVERESDTDLPLPVALLVDADGVLRDISRPEDVTAYSSQSRIAQQLRLLPQAA